MTAERAKQEATWNGLPKVVRKKIKKAVKKGKYMVKLLPYDYAYGTWDVVTDMHTSSVNRMLRDLGYETAIYRDCNTTLISEIKVTWE